VQYTVKDGVPRDRVTDYTLTSGPNLGQPRSVIGPDTQVSASADNPPNEVGQNLVDGNPGTKWLAFQPAATLTFKLNHPVTTVRYSLTSANDAPERDPRDWTLSGSTDGTAWTTLDSQTGQAFTGRFQTRDYTFTNTTAYQYYRLTITANAGGVNLLQLAEFGLSDGVTTGDPVSWVLKGSYDGTTWTTVDQRVNQTFPWRLQTREFAVRNPGRFSRYRLEVTGNTGDRATTLAEVELLAKPDPPCTATVSGQHSGSLTVSSGVTCLTPGATVTGPVVVRSGGSLYGFDATIGGPVTATGATALVLVHSTVAGPVTATGTTGELSLENSTVGGPVSLVNNAGPEDTPPLVAADRIGGPLSCVANDPAPVNDGLTNTADGGKVAQCQAL
jgi:hypothetical protein